TLPHPVCRRKVRRVIDSRVVPWDGSWVAILLLLYTLDARHCHWASPSPQRPSLRERPIIRRPRAGVYGRLGGKGGMGPPLQGETARFWPVLRLSPCEAVCHADRVR